MSDEICRDIAVAALLLDRVFTKHNLGAPAVQISPTAERYIKASFAASSELAVISPTPSGVADIRIAGVRFVVD